MLIKMIKVVLITNGEYEKNDDLLADCLHFLNTEKLTGKELRRHKGS